MHEWISLVKRKPSSEGIYKVLKLGHSGDFHQGLCRWMENCGFQPLDCYNDREWYPINMNVTHWVDLNFDVPANILQEASDMIVYTETFFKTMVSSKTNQGDDFKVLIKVFNLEVHEEVSNAYTIVIDKLTDDVLKHIRSYFRSNGIKKEIRKS